MRKSFVIKTPVFEGPLELLLSLIEKRKLFINDIALASVADEYMEHVRTLSEFPMRDVAQFVLVAATLVLIKSKSLLPEFTLTPEEEGDIADLQSRLAQYQRIQRLSKELGALFGKRVLFPREQSSLYHEAIFAPHPSLSVAALHDALSGVIARLPKTETLKKAIVEKIMSLEDMMERLAGRIKNAMSLRFSEFSKAHAGESATPREEKINTIVSFLAMLELVKQGMLAVRQHMAFDDIEMHTESVSTPSYS